MRGVARNWKFLPGFSGNFPAGTKLVLEAATGRDAFPWKACDDAPDKEKDVVTTKLRLKICRPGEDVGGADGGAKRRKVSGPAGQEAPPPHSLTHSLTRLALKS